MSTIHFRSSVLASAFGIALLGAVLTGSTVTVPDEVGRKGDLRLAASDCFGGCAKNTTRLTHYETAVDVDQANGVITLERERIGD
jgi:hypothetical protein